MASVAGSAPYRPVDDGSAIDSTLDGIGDTTFNGLGSVLVGFNTVISPGEHRGVFEFDLTAVHGCPEIDATLRLSFAGSHLNEIDPNLTLYGGGGNGVLDAGDFNAGSFLGSFTVQVAQGAFTFFDVSAAVQGLSDRGSAFAAFIVRPNPVDAANVGAWLYASNEIVDAFGFAPTLIELTCLSRLLEIDVEPRDESNRINLRRHTKVTVAVLSSSDFPASSLNPASIRFGALGTEASPAQSLLEDADRDGDIDLVLRFRIRETGLACGNTTAFLRGTTSGGDSAYGSDVVRTAGCP